MRHLCDYECSVFNFHHRDPYRYSDDEYDDDEDDEDILKPTKVDIDISMSAYGNSRKYVKLNTLFVSDFGGKYMHTTIFSTVDLSLGFEDIV